MTRYVLAPIVEGEGDVSALPVLIRRLDPMMDVARSLRIHRQQAVVESELVRFVHIAESNIAERGGVGGVLLLLDSDRDCAATQSAILAEQIRRTIPHRISRCVFAVREFECWLVAGDESSGEVPDETRGSKAWLRQRDGRYSPTADQPRLTQEFDIERACRVSRSFRKLHKVVGEFTADANRSLAK